MYPTSNIGPIAWKRVSDASRHQVVSPRFISYTLSELRGNPSPRKYAPSAKISLVSGIILLLPTESQTFNLHLELRQNNGVRTKKLSPIRISTTPLCTGSYGSAH
jgi:hypothetical protein